jgi:hypothetical protein
MSMIVRAFLAILFGLWFFVSPASAALLLTVDASDPTHVDFTALAGLSEASSSGVNFAIRLDGAVTSLTREVAFLQSAGQPLSPIQGGIPYRIAAQIGPTDLDLIGASGSTQVFTAGQLAFTGSSFTDLSPFTLASHDFIGNIVVRDTRGRSTDIIGQYQFIAPVPAAVPLPPSLLLLACGAINLVLFARRRPA